METGSASMQLLRGNDRQEQVGLALLAEMQRDVAAEDPGRPVAEVVVDEGPAAAHRVLHIGERCRLAAVVVVLAAYRQRDAPALGHDDAGRPDLDVELDNFPG